LLIALSETCPIFAPSSTVALHKLLGTIVTSRHILILPTPSRLENVVSPSTWSIYGEYLKQSYKRAVNTTRSWSSHDDCEACSPANIADFYSLPLLLIVENNTSDGDWLRLVIERFRPALRGSLDGASPALDVRQAGGIAEIPKELRRHATARAAIKPRGQIPLRIVALCDSDARAPGQWSPAAREVAAAAKETGADYHVLNKKSIENYIPDDALIAYAATRTHAKEAVDYIVGLSPTQRDYYPMKNGLRHSDLDTGSVYPNDSALGLKLGDFIVDFLTNFRHHVSAHELNCRDGQSELKALLDLLEENL
jgi:hypothetical protein